MKNEKLLWTLTIINSTLIFLFLIAVFIEVINPPEDTTYDQYVKYTEENDKLLREYVEKNIEKQNDYVSEEVQRLYDFVNKN